MTRPRVARRSSPARSTATTSSAPPTPVRSRRPASPWSTRPPFNILYLAINQAVPALQTSGCARRSPYAIDKEQLVTQVLPEGTEKATQFMPHAVNGWNPDVTTYEYDPEKAKALLAEAGYTRANPLTLEFNYPVNVSRPYMPDPEQIFTVLSSQLEAVGIVRHPGERGLEPRLPRPHPGSAGPRHPPARLDRRLQRHRQLRRTFFAGQQAASGASTTRSCSRRCTRPAGSPSLEEQAARTKRSTRWSRSSSRASRWRTRPRRWRSRQRVESYPASPVNDEVFTDIVLTE